MRTRIRCYRCHRPETQCLCGFIGHVDPRTEILILQHPRERAHAFNTARLAELSLNGARVQVGYVRELAADESLRRGLSGFGLLYPRPDALDLSQLPPEQRPKKLVVLDGTWHHARAMYREIEALHDLQHYTLPPGQVSGFQIRRQPKSYCLSTLEAIHSALECLEPETPGLDQLLQPFDEMQRQHLASMTSASPRFNGKRRRRERKALPDVLADAFESLVVVYGEMGPVIEGVDQRPLLTFAAERPATGERLMALVEPIERESERWPFLRLEGDPLGPPVALDALRERWRQFLRPGDVVAAWSRSTLRVVDAHLSSATEMLPPGDRLSLKSTYCSFHERRGCLEQIVAASGLIEEPERLRLLERASRTEERLANAVAIATWIQATGVPPRSVQKVPDSV
ncbi:MAG: tRNA-uridine aminocarboxypropyltransferase [Planctomycetota bacterium]